MLEVGVYPASVTPLKADGSLDTPSLARLLAYFEHQGCRGVVIGGTNGEGPSMSAPLKRDLLRAASQCRGKLKLILGVSSSALDEAIWLCQQGAKSGADAALVMPPSYFREVEERAISDWFERLLDASPLPILVYNFPQRTGLSLSASMLQGLADHPKFLGVKDSSGDPTHLRDWKLQSRHVRFVGDETLLADAIAAGWTGTISGAANSIPGWLVRAVNERCEGPVWSLILPILRQIRALPQPAGHKHVLFRQAILESAAVFPPLLEPDPALYEPVLRTLSEKLGIRFSASSAIEDH